MSRTCPMCGSVIGERPVSAKAHLDKLIDEWNNTKDPYLLQPTEDMITEKLTSRGINLEQIMGISLDDISLSVSLWLAHVKSVGPTKLRPRWGLGYVRNAILDRMDTAREEDKKQEHVDALKNQVVVQLAKSREAEDERQKIRRWWETVLPKTKTQLFIEHKEEFNLTSTTEQAVMLWSWTKLKESE